MKAKQERVSASVVVRPVKTNQTQGGTDVGIDKQEFARLVMERIQAKAPSDQLAYDASSDSVYSEATGRSADLTTYHRKYCRLNDNERDQALDRYALLLLASVIVVPRLMAVRQRELPRPIGVEEDPASHEVVRMWWGTENTYTRISSKVYEHEPFALGVVLTGLARCMARDYARCKGMDAEEANFHIALGFLETSNIPRDAIIESLESFKSESEKGKR